MSVVSETSAQFIRELSDEEWREFRMTVPNDLEGGYSPRVHADDVRMRLDAPVCVPAETVEIEAAVAAWRARHDAPSPVDLREIETFSEIETLRAELAQVRAELATEQNREFTEYDPRMLPMVRKLARAATAAGFCNEYDRLMEVVNAPARDEILAREYTYTVPVDVTLRVTIPLSSTGSDADDAWENLDWDSDEVKELVADQLGISSYDIDDVEIRGYENYETGDFVDL